MGRGAVCGKKKADWSWTVIEAAVEREEDPNQSIRSQNIIPAGSFIIPDGVKEIHIFSNSFFGSSFADDPGAELIPVSTSAPMGIWYHLSRNANGEWECTFSNWNNREETYFTRTIDLNDSSGRMRLSGNVLTWVSVSGNASAVYYKVRRSSAMVQYA